MTTRIGWDFNGEGVDKQVYLVQQPGTQVFPAITDAWWDPSSKQLHTKTLPSVTFEVAIPLGANASTEDAASHRASFRW